MAVVMEMKWEGVTPAQYDEAKRLTDWEAHPAAGSIVHIAFFDNGSLRCYDVWESAQDFGDFVQKRLKPAVTSAGIEGQPDVQYYAAHDVHINEASLASVR